MKLRTLAFIAITVILAFAGCSKSDDDPGTRSDYYFRYKVDGAREDYQYGNNQVNLMATRGYDPNTKTYTINIAGMKNIMESGKNTVTILISDTKELVMGVNYSNIPGEGDAYPGFLFTMGYYNKDGNLYVAGGQGDSPIFAEIYEPAFVKITEMTDNHVAGTFSGKLIWYDTSQGKNEFIDDVEITEGEFKVPRK